MFKAFTLAGSDTSGGAGIQADLKTFQERDVYGMCAITTIVTMDPDNEWNHLIFPIAIDTLKQQIKTILQGIGIDAMKTGMLASEEIITLAAETIETYQIKNVVVDPVMVCKGADKQTFPKVNDAIRDILLPKALVVTPNLFEAEQLSGMKNVETLDDMKKAAIKIHALGVPYVLIKGGGKLQNTDQALDVLYDGKDFEILSAKKNYWRIQSWSWLYN